MNASLTRFVLAVVAALLITAAGTYLVDLSTRKRTEPTTGAVSGPATSAAAAGVPLTIVSFQFTPDPVAVKAGRPITVTNQDDAKHTVTSGTLNNTDGKFDVPIDGADVKTFSIPTPGTYPYICTIHPGMKGTIEVSS